MGVNDASGSEMRRLRGLRPTDPPPLDPDTAERMLAGAVDPADAPPGYAGVVRVLAAAAAPPSAGELDGEREAVAAFRAAHRPLDPSRRKPVLGKLVSAKVLAGIAAGVVSVGTAAAAATGTLPGPAQDVAHRILHGAGKSDDAGPAETHPASRPSPTSLPGAVGLCRAWAAGQSGEHGKKLDATAFQRLEHTAHDAGKSVASYCSTLPDAAAKSSARTRATPTHAPAHAVDAALVGLCRAWSTAVSHGQTARLSKDITDRLSSAAGGMDKVTTYCRSLLAASASSHAGAPANGHDTQPTEPQPTDHSRHMGTPVPTPHG